MPSTSRTALSLSTLAVGCTSALLLLPALPAWAASPTITALSPTTTHVGRTVAVRGSDLGGASAVTLAGTTVPFTQVDAGEVDLTVPSGASSGAVVVSTPDGSATSAGQLTVAPAPVLSGLSAVVGAHGAQLRWSAAGTGTTVVRDVTGVASPWTTTSGRAVPVRGLGAVDSGFANTSTATYAVWAADADGTTSDAPTSVDLAKTAPAATTLTLASSVTRILIGRSVVFTGSLIRAGVPLAGERVDLVARTGGAAVHETIAHLVSGADGRVRAVVAPTRSREFVLRYAGSAYSAASASSARAVALQPLVSLSLSPAGIVHGESTLVSGRTTPALAGAVVRLQVRRGTTWSTIRTFTTSAAGRFGTPLAPALGAYDVRAVLAATPAWAQAVSPSAVLRVDARDLVVGDHGADVLALQRRLLALHYDPGAANGTYGRDTQHAVYAFEKVEGLPRLGRWTRPERVRVAAPRGYRVRHASAGRAVEVDVTRQVLALTQGGRVLLLADVSTAGEYDYTYAGVTYHAHTPRGRFAVQRKIDGVRISNLGYLYRPSYFTGGYAIHGEGYDVPTTPASHGCVRVTNLLADVLFPVLTIGTPVTVFDE